MKLSTRLAVGFGSLTLIAAGLGIGSYCGSSRNAATIRDLAEVQIPAFNALTEVKNALSVIKATQRTMMNLGIDSTVRQRQDLLLNKARTLSEAAFKTYEPLPKTPEEDALWNQFKTEWQTWRKESDEFLRLFQEVEALKIGNPLRLECDLARFRGDHYKVEKQIQNMFQSQKTFEGGENHASCGFGKWKATQRIENPDIVKLLQEISLSHQKFHEAVKQTKELVKAGNVDGAKKIYVEEVEPAADQTLARFDAMLAISALASELGNNMNHQALDVCRVSQLKAEDLLERLVNANNQEATQHSHKAVSLAAFFMNFSLVLVGVGLATGVALTIGITRSITRPIRSLTESLSVGADQTTSAAGQVSAASQSLAEGASEQAASLEETSASIEEMSSMTKRNTENAEKANDLAKRARAAAEKGSADMQSMNTAMDAIKSSSDDIAKIIKTIDEIAFQTNILALNAAVEAARAGEAGMGFAVVADEVRNLAQRSGQAAKETSAKIEGAICKTKQGVEISGKVAKSLAEIVTQARQVDELVAEVATASKEQSQGIEQVNTAVNQMDKVTQNNAASAEESASAAEELNAQAESVKEAVAELMALVSGKGGRGRVPGRMPGERESRPHGSGSRYIVCAGPDEPDRQSSFRVALKAGAAAALPPAQNLIEWDAATMSTGVETVDAEHGELISMINRLHQACQRGAGREEILKMLHFLGGYAQDHFSHEEGVMETHRCPARGANKSAHRQFLQDYEKLVETVKREGTTTSILLQLKTLVSDWLRNHICSVDTRLRECVSRGDPGDRTTASEASGHLNLH